MPGSDRPTDELLAATLRDDPPVRATRRVAAEPAHIGSAAVAEGTLLLLDLAAGGDEHLPFGSGLRPCPGREHALALAAGVLDAFR
jgi:cytochrome P450